MALTRQELNTLEDMIYGGLHYWSPCDYHSDYICTFCGSRARTNDSAIKHDENCDGLKMSRRIMEEIIELEPD